MIDLKTRAVAPFFPDARTFHNIYKSQKHALLRYQSYLIVFMGNKNLRFWQIFKKYKKKWDNLCATAKTEVSLHRRSQRQTDN